MPFSVPSECEIHEVEIAILGKFLGIVREEIKKSVCGGETEYEQTQHTLAILTGLYTKLESQRASMLVDVV